MRAVIYAAKSTADEHGSIPTQLADCRAMAERKGWEVVGEYKDEAKSAFTGDRGAELAAALAECERLSPCALIVQHSDRLARGDAKQARHLIEVVLWALKHDVQLLSVQDPEILAGGDMALLLGAIGGMRNHQDSKRKGLAVSAGHRRRAADRGKPFRGGRRTFGYRWIDDSRTDGHFEPVPKEAAIVREMFDRALNGASAKAIARWLGDEGVESTAPGKLLNRPSTIGRMLSNPTYAGRVPYKGEVFPGAHEAIVDPAVFDRVQALRSSPSRQAGGRPPKGQHLLTRGLLRCGKCGAAMIPMTRQSQTYECFTRMNEGTDRCDQKPVRRELVDDALLSDLLTHFVDLEETKRRIEERMTADLSVAHETLNDAQGEVLRKQESIGRVERDYLDGKLAVEKWERFEAKLTAELDGAQEALLRAQGHVTEVEQADDLRDAEEALLRLLADLRAAATGGLEHAPNLAALRTILLDMFERIDLVSGGRLPANLNACDGTLLVDHGSTVQSGSERLQLWLWVRDDFIAGLLPADDKRLEAGYFADGAYAMRKVTLPPLQTSPTSRTQRSP